MTPKLTNEQLQAVLAGGGQPIPAEHEPTQSVYFIYNEGLHQKAMDALRRQEDMDAIQAGIDDMEADRVTPFAEVDARMRKKLGLPDRT